MSQPPWKLWQKAAERLDHALGLSTGARRDYLEEVKRDDPRVARELETLLAAQDALGEFLEHPAAESFEASDAAETDSVELDSGPSNSDPSNETNVTAASWVGRTLGPYEILGPLGRGGMGEVYRALDPRLGRQLAIKTLPVSRHLDREARQRLEREARSVAALDHPNLCTLHDIGETADGELYLVMAFYEGHTLEERLRGGPLPLAEALEIAIALAEGLEYAHRAGIVHRDIKPANILLTEQKMIKLLDFGIAKAGRTGELAGSAGEEASRTLTSTGMALGTPAYMAPEQLLGEVSGPAADLWALGIVLYEMIAGRRPFAGGRRVLRSILTAKPPTLARLGYPRTVSRLVERMLEKSPAKRFTEAGELVKALRQMRQAVTSKDLARGGNSERPQRVWALGLWILAVPLAGLLIWGIQLKLAPMPSSSMPSSSRPSPVLRIEVPPVLEVLPFANQTGDPSLDAYAAGVTRLVRDALSTSRSVRVLAESSNGVRTESTVAKSTRTTVSGELLAAGEGYLVATRVRDGSTGEQVTAVRSDPTTPAGLYLAVDEVARAVRRALRVPLSESVDVFAADFASRNPDAYELYLAGLEHLAAYRHDEAEAEFRRALDRAPGFTMARYRLAQVLASRGRTREAQEHLQRAVAESATLDDREARYVRATAALVDRRYDVAIEGLRDLVERYPYEIDAHHLLVLSLRGARHFEEALDALDTLAELEPDRSVVWSLRGETLLALGRPAEAVEALERYVALEPDSANGFHLMADAYRAQGELSLAAESYRRALEKDPNFYFSTVQLAIVDVLTGDEALALARLLELAGNVAAGPRHRLDATFEAVSILRGEGRFHRALGLLEDAEPLLAEEKVRGALALSLRALCHLELGDLDVAGELAAKATEDPPGSLSRYLVVRGLVELASGHLRAFDATVGQLLADSPVPGGANAERAAAFLSGRRLLVEGRFQDAVSVLRRAVSHEQSSTSYAYAVYRLSLAEALLAAGQVREAEAMARQASQEVDPAAPRLDLLLDRRRGLLVLAQAQAASGRPRDAAATAERCLELWREADSGLAFVDQARFLAGLGSQRVESITAVDP